MTPPLRIALTLGIFATTVVLVVWKPRGLHEAWSACGGAALALLLGLVSPTEAVAVAVEGRSVLLFLLALLTLAALIDASGFFGWAAMHAARSARGRVSWLFRNIFVLGSVVTFVLSLDTTAVLLTPLVIAFCKRLDLKPAPWVIACAMVSNAASLALPISNLTNLLLLEHFHVPVATYVLRMALPQLVVLVATFTLLRLYFRQELAGVFATTQVDAPQSYVTHQRYFVASVVTLVSTFVLLSAAPSLHLAPYGVAFGACAVLGAYGLYTKRVSWAMARRIPVRLVPFALGLFVLVRAVENLGLSRSVESVLKSAPFPGVSYTFAAAAAANLTNNLPATLLLEGVLSHDSDEAVLATLIGVDVGPNIVPFASLATMLVLATAEAGGARVSGRQFLRVGLLTTPIVLVLGALALAFTYAVIPR
ncbi:MAG: ArsB/NhaD family transporter [Polyangiaceae bacterium]